MPSHGSELQLCIIGGTNHNSQGKRFGGKEFEYWCTRNICVMCGRDCTAVGVLLKRRRKILRKSFDMKVVIIMYLVIILVLITNILQHEFSDNSVKYDR